MAAPGAAVDALAATAPVADLDDFRSNRRYAKYFTQRIRWSAKTCPKGGFFNGIMECARIKVPKDWYHLSAGDIYVGLSRLGGDAKQPRRSRLLLTNPGGPGADGLEFGVISALFLGVNKTHTTIGIDPRGVGLSTQLRCSNERLAAGSYRADGDSRSYTPEQVAADAKGRAAYVSACARTTKSFLPYVNSDQTARDFNLVRHLMGYKTLDYYGVSYGTWLGSLLEKMFPNKVARVVLDANTDWAGGSVDKVFSYQPMAFQAQFDRVFLPWLGRHDAAYHLGGSAQAVNDTYERIREAARAGRFGRIGTPDILDAYLAQAQYSTFAWDDAGVMMGKMLAAMDGDAAALTDVQDVFTETAKDDVDVRSVYIAVRCNDTAAERSTSRWFAATEPLAKAYPLTGATELANPCASWPYRPALSRAVLARPVRGVLMLQTEADPATGYLGALNTRMKAKGQLRMVTVDDAPGHGSGLLVSECAGKAVVSYLSKGVYPKGNVYCASTPIQSGEVSDTRVYEFFNRASTSRPLPAPYAYPQRDLREPAVDPTVTARAGAPTPTLPFGATGLAWPWTERRPLNPWAEPFAALLAAAATP